ncbi:MAG: tyrosine--tRNA ligase [Bdellovibrionales bacterium]|nr:tyrosine--tRNA ligase [Bdellovibrionales bacterium]
MLFAELESRGLAYQCTSDDLKKALETPMSFYCGFDPTSDSLHVGSLLPLMTMRRLQDRGHKPIMLLGGATGMIGDPSGKSKERNLQSRDIINANALGIKKNAERVLDFSGPNGAQLVNNADWMATYSYIDFLRDIGKHFTVNYMTAKDSVKSRVENSEHGISYTEFSYMLLQAYDFYHLHKTQNCQLQIGASDQWGNITAGVELIRRMQGESHNKDVAFGLTFPLVTKPDGTKFGKTESGNVWLSPDKTSPYQFYQFFLRLPDDEVLKLLKYFSLKSLNEISVLESAMQSAPQERAAQNALAEELTTLIHGQDELKRVKHASQVLFSGELQQLDEKTLKEVFSEAPSVQVAKTQKAEITLVDVLVQSQLCSSKGAARKDIKAGAIYLNNQRFEGEDLPGNDLPLLFDSLLVLRRGKKSYCLVQFS